MIDMDGLIARFGPAIADFSSTIMHGLPHILDGMRFKSVVEIGTMNGLSAAELAMHCDHVTTIDVIDRPVVDEVFAFLGLTGKIDRVVVKDEAEKAKIIDGLTFDMAFLDGQHGRAGLLWDFALTRRCGCLLFHDYPKVVNPGDPEVYGWRQYPPELLVGDGAGFLLDGIVPAGVIERHPPFAWWRVINA